MFLIAQLSWPIPNGFLKEQSAGASPKVSTFYVAVFFSLTTACGWLSFVELLGRQLQGLACFVWATVMENRKDGLPETMPVKAWVLGELVNMHRNLNHQSWEWRLDLLQ